MLASYDAAPKKPEKATKTDKVIVEKRDTEVANKQKPKEQSNKSDGRKKH
jgi:hypothetical protein